MLKIILIVTALIFLGTEAVLSWQFFRCLKLHKNDTVETHSRYLIQRLNAMEIIGFAEALLLLVLIFLK